MVLITVTTTEIIKPFSLTLPLNKPIKLSLFDQICPLSYSPAILFYTNKDHNLTKIPNTSVQLKDSLSRVLDPFRPLAGRVRDHSFIECNDEGVLYSEANVNCPMSDFLAGLKSDKETRDLNKFLPCTPLVKLPDSSVPPLAVRVTFFADGSGVAISMCVLHTITDAVGMHYFLNSWAEAMRGRFDRLTPPDFTIGYALYPQRESPVAPPLLPLRALSSTLEMFVFRDASLETATRRFWFKNEAIESLRARAKSEEVAKPTRYESLSSFIWKHIMEASKKVHGSAVPLPSVAAHAVNTRRRMDPPLGNHCMNNFQNAALVKPTENIELPTLVKATHKSLGGVNSQLMKMMEGEKCYEILSQVCAKEMSEAAPQIDKIDLVFFSSWNNMGFYDVDFGWGKPDWVGVFGQGEANSGIGNLVFFVETSSKDGIEVIITLEEKKMAALENNPDFLKFVASNPTV